MRYWYRSKSKILSAITIFLLFYLVFSFGVNITSLFKSGFSNYEILSELHQHRQLKERYQLTGIILHWQRLTGVRDLLRTMLDFDDLFVHIIIWNNNPKKNLTVADLLVESSDRIEIVNSPENIKDQAKYRACQLAKTNACFYADDDWDVRMYVRSLYSSFLLEPTILHAMTDQFTYFTNVMWTFFDTQIDLHTGFSWIGCGSIFSRENAIRHLGYLDYFLDSEENRDLARQGDQFFSIWMNQIPAQFNGRLIHSDEGAMSSFENYDFDMIQHRASILSIEILEKTLRFSPQSKIFERKRATNSLVTYTKSPCSYNDRFIFFTNCLPIDDVEEIPFNITTDIKRGTRSNLPNEPTCPYRYEHKFFENFSTANAVDNNTETCWKTRHPVERGDFYGLDFQTIQISGDLAFTIEYSHRKSLQKRLQISISLDGYRWLTLPAHNRLGITYKKRKKIVYFRTQLFPDGFRMFRFIKFMSLTEEEDSFHICEVRLIDS
ncbi:unnamed protein product [Adineta ricciae]|uniref:Uncharacterized protein n=1 Tax=Adineta ricciae TaxID=249248 RepID=A0A813YNP0_ADIRI|nr:unnamed protein product [Adineta ricciae]CAF1505144.1 unnamed protein product [Adineta ricciae]